jgi:hypothetical protein
MLSARMFTIVASSITLLGGIVTMSEARSARAEAGQCFYGYAGLCYGRGEDLCPTGWHLTCSAHCTMPECEDYYAYSCCLLV